MKSADADHWSAQRDFVTVRQDNLAALSNCNGRIRWRAYVRWPRHGFGFCASGALRGGTGRPDVGLAHFTAVPAQRRLRCAAKLELLDPKQPAPFRLIREAVGQSSFGVLATEEHLDRLAIPRLDEPPNAHAGSLTARKSTLAR